VEHTQLGPIDRASSCLQIPTPTKRCVLNKNRTMDNVQKNNNCIDIPSSQTLNLIDTEDSW
jgi:hypothetical protein